MLSDTFRPLGIALRHRGLVMSKLSLTPSFSYLAIKVKPNNIFFTLKTFNNNKFEHVIKRTSGHYKITVSKKLMKRTLRFILAAFFKELKQKKLVFADLVLVKLTAPVKLKKTIIRSFIDDLKVRNYILDVVAAKVFNGCRARKQIKKKRKGFRLLKN